ncbi:wall-associated RHS family protein, putative [Listeria monocytogenes FSL J1-208]|nr:wall-associated RHS family protein, putative [Listeria monocytogenes FSL J1-208]
MSKTVDGVTTNYHYDGDSIDVLYETDGDGKVVRQYVYSDDNVRLAMKMNGKTLYYHYNAHGDVIALTDEAGKIVAEYAYDAWGNVLKNTASTEEAKANPYGYAGYTYDKEIEQYYLMARYYEPEQGVFTAYDPDPGDEDDPQTMNGYNYANNNPVMLFDTDGNYAHVAAVGMAFGPIDWGIALGVSAAWAGYQVYKWHKSKKGSNYSYAKKKNKGKKKIKSKNITKGKGVKNYKLNVTRKQLETRLRQQGWKSVKRKGAREFSKNGRRIVTRSKSKQGNPTADYYKKGSKKISKKFRLKKRG